MSYESSSRMLKAAERVVGSIGRVVDSEHTPPIRGVALGALVGFAVAAAGITAGQTIVESIRGQEKYYVPDSE